MATCPVCNSQATRRSARRNLKERLRSIFTGQYPYRCFDCQTRFYAYRMKHVESPEKEDDAEDDEKD